MNKEKSCGAVIYKKNNNQINYLLICAKYDHHWSFPKGHVEKDETELQTALREIKEETNLEPIIDVNFRNVITYSPRVGILKDVIFFIGLVNDNQKVKIQPSEVIAYKWLPYEEAVKAVTYDNDRNTLINANKYLCQEVNA